ncbi:D-alanine--D-alanine ligase [Aliifodinibius salicampi]|uniref:D-alanine--D-alanine ligase n=1 Tax=Fodinibius salicampi TaxID=1920655 RepID=A0ABT3PZ40_9BACT|nr:D-alanine--D-alanine ligase [Fodinibius salicampi]MCW9713132.1 D-alanine--D-alanine ligase [Fodinibius salicampi]
MSDKNIVVAFGGVSPEHEVSVLSAMQVIAALEDSHYNLIPLYVSKSGRWLTGKPLLELENYQDLDTLIKEASPCTFTHNKLGKPVLQETESGWFQSPESSTIHAVIPAFHGSEGENGSFQGTCEMYNIPYAGSGVFASSLGMDKVKAKELCRAHNIPVVDGIDFYEQEWAEKQEEIIERAEQLDYPLIIKPVTLGSSIGVNRAEKRDELIKAVETTFRFDNSLMVEKAVTPLLEVNCSILGTPQEMQHSVCERPLGQDETLSFEDKYQNEEGTQKGMASADRQIPADISNELTQKIQSLSRKIFSLFRASGVARLDFLINENTKEVYFNEINTIPGSFSFYLWEESEIDMQDLMLELIDIAIEQHQRKIGRIRSYETNLLSEKAVKGIKGLKGTDNKS